MKILRLRPLPVRPIPLFATLMLLLAAAPDALAQTSKPKKKDAKPADTTEVAPDPAPKSSSPSSDDETKKPDKAATSAASETSTMMEVPATQTEELPGKRYIFIGARYRATVIPQFMVNLFVDEGATFLSHSFGFEVDLRKDNQSTIPWIVYQSFGFGDTLFHQKNPDPTTLPDSNWSVVNSGLSAIFIGLDELWSAPIDEGHHWDFEYGFGVGVGAVFGTLQNDWVYSNQNGPLKSANSGNFSECQTAGPPGSSCDVHSHKNATTPKVAGYTEPNWFNGGSVPVIFPHIALPQLGLRWKPVKKFEMRLSAGFSLTGFFIGLSGNYGLEKPPEGQGPGGGGLAHASPGSMTW
jgi:hypothetical protein